MVDMPVIDPFWGDVAFYSHCDGLSGATNVVDECGNVQTANVGDSIVTLNSAPGYGQSLSIPGVIGNGVQFATNPQLNLPGDFTIEFRWYTPGYGADGGLIKRGNYPNNNSWGVMCTNVNSIRMIGYDGAGNRFIFDLSGHSPLIPNNNWNSFAICRSGVTLMGFINGKKVLTVVNPGGFGGANLSSTLPFYLGAVYSGSAPAGGQLDEVRITRKCRYFDDYVLSTGPFPTFAPPPAVMVQLTNNALYVPPR